MRHLLSRYVTFLFLQAALLFSSGLILLASIIDFAVRMKQFLEVKESTLEFIGEYYLLKIPFLLPFLLPPALLMAAAFTLIRLARSNEIVPILMGGRSMRHVCLPFLGASLIVAALVGSIEEYVLPAFGARMNLMEERAHRADLSLAKSARSVNGDLMYCREFDWSTLTGRSIQITILDSKGQLAREILAERATWKSDKKEWFLTHGHYQDFLNGRRKTKQLPDGSEALDRTVFESEGYAVSIGIEPANFTTFNFYSNFRPLRETRELVRRYSNVSGYRSQMYQRFMSPFTPIVLMLLGLPLVATVRSRGSFFVGSALCFLVVVTYFGAILFAQTLGVRGFVSLELASFGPVLMFGLLGLFRYSTMRT